MKNIDDYELEVLSAYEKGKLKSVATKGELAKFKAAARATAIKGSVMEKRKGDREIGN